MNLGSCHGDYMYVLNMDWVDSISTNDSKICVI